MGAGHDAGQAALRPDTGHDRRRWLIRLLVGVLALAVIATTATWVYARSLNNGVRRTDVFGGMSSRPGQKVTGAMNVLAVGSDSRDPGNTAGSRGDTMMLVHVDASHRHAYVISIPRDTWVDVPGTPGGGEGHTMAKINSAYAWGGLPLAVRTVEQFTGVRIDHAMTIDFAGFQRVVDALGGVTMTVDQTIRSIHPPHRLFTKGEHQFTGAQALDYVRQREQFPDGDFTRERHQQQFLHALLDKAASTGTLANPAKLNAFLRSATRAITVDQGFDVAGTAVELRGLRSKDITYLRSPSAGFGEEGGQSVVLADTEQAKAFYAAVAADTMSGWVAAHPSPSAGAATGSSPASPGSPSG